MPFVEIGPNSYVNLDEVKFAILHPKQKIAAIHLVGGGKVIANYDEANGAFKDLVTNSSILELGNKNVVNEHMFCKRLDNPDAIMYVNMRAVQHLQQHRNQWIVQFTKDDSQVFTVPIAEPVVEEEVKPKKTPKKSSTKSKKAEEAKVPIPEEEKPDEATAGFISADNPKLTDKNVAAFKGTEPF